MCIRDRASALSPVSAVDTQSARCSRALTRGTHPAQPLDQHGVVGERGGRVDQRVEHLVVPGGRHGEELADRLLLGPGVLPPLPLEGEDLLVAVREVDRRGTQAGGQRGGLVVHPWSSTAVHPALCGAYRAIVAAESHGCHYPVRACISPVSYTHLRAHETVLDLVCRL